MTRDDDFIGQLEGYLHDFEGLTPLPDAVHTAVRAQLVTTRQLDRFNSNIVRFGLAAAAIVIALIIGAQYLSRNVGKDASPTPVASSEESPTNGISGVNSILHPLGTPNEQFEVQYTLPEGWSRHAFTGCLVPATGQVGPDGSGICFFTPTTVHRDPCHADNPYTLESEVPIGPTVDDLVSAIGAQTAYEATPATDVSLGGYQGKRMDLQLPDSDFATCDGGRFVPWHESIGAQGAANRWHLWILDVSGLRVVILAHDFPGTPTQTQEELYAVIGSFRFGLFAQPWPGAAGNAPGRYSWGAGSRRPMNGAYGFMHNGYQTLGEGQEVAMSFAFASETDPDATDVVVAGFPGTYHERIGADGSRTERWTMEIEGETLAITVQAEPNTTSAQFAEVHAIIESIRYEPTNAGAFRVTFMLPAGWDSG